MVLCMRSFRTQWGTSRALERREGINQAISPAPCSGLQGINLYSVQRSQLGCLPGKSPWAVLRSPVPLSAHVCPKHQGAEAVLNMHMTRVTKVDVTCLWGVVYHACMQNSPWAMCRDWCDTLGKPWVPWDFSGKASSLA